MCSLFFIWCLWTYIHERRCYLMLPYILSCETSPSLNMIFATYLQFTMQQYMKLYIAMQWAEGLQTRRDIHKHDAVDTAYLYIAGRLTKTGARVLACFNWRSKQWLCKSGIVMINNRFQQLHTPWSSPTLRLRVMGSMSTSLPHIFTKSFQITWRLPQMELKVSIATLYPPLFGR